MSDLNDTATALPFVVRADGDREVYRLADDLGPHANWPVASMCVYDDDCVHVALSRNFADGCTVVVAVLSEDDARALCETHATLMAKLAEVEVTA